MQLREQNPEVFYASDRIVTVGDDEIRFLKERAAQNPRLRSRLCTHPDPSASVHEMLIVHHESVYVRPHHHVAKSESFHIVEGAALVVLMDQTGGIVSVIPVGDPKTGRAFYYRMPDTLMHTFIIESEWLVFHETTGGPFDPEKTVFAAWSPDGTNDEQSQRYLGDLAARAREFLETRSPIS
jgi:cupin fold WbuC family metalloprotein